jgi:hypothetical protein
LTAGIVPVVARDLEAEHFRNERMGRRLHEIRRKGADQRVDLAVAAST